MLDMVVSTQELGLSNMVELNPLTVSMR